MAGYIANGWAIDYYDGEGSAMVNGRLIRWEHHEWMGPLFLRADGNPLKRQPGENHPVWPRFEEWLKRYTAARAKAKESEIVKV